jgi:SAM-dependent methyltransferase
MPISPLQFNQEQHYLVLVLSKFSRNARVLDLGCGSGRNLELLRQMGFANIVGADINPDMISIATSKGFECIHSASLSFEAEQWDIIIMSHLIEHFQYEPLLKFIESHVRTLLVGGHLIISTPLLTQSFYNDFDHIKPYNPLGLKMMFGSQVEQIQVQSKIHLELKDLYFYQLPWRLQWFSTFYLPGQQRWPHWINSIGRILYCLSRGIVGVKSGWVGSFQLVKGPGA